MLCSTPLLGFRPHILYSSSNDISPEMKDPISSKNGTQFLAMINWRIRLISTVWHFSHDRRRKPEDTSTNPRLLQSPLWTILTPILQYERPPRIAANSHPDHDKEVAAYGNGTSVPVALAKQMPRGG